MQQRKAVQNTLSTSMHDTGARNSVAAKHFPSQNAEKAHEMAPNKGSRTGPNKTLVCNYGNQSSGASSAASHTSQRKSTGREAPRPTIVCANTRGVPVRGSRPSPAKAPVTAPRAVPPRLRRWFWVQLGSLKRKSSFVVQVVVPIGRRKSSPVRERMRASHTSSASTTLMQLEATLRTRERLWGREALERRAATTRMSCSVVLPTQSLPW